MVGNGVDLKNSRIFQQCYLKCCKLQNLTPLSNVLTSGNGKVLDFCVDRIKYVDWPPILNAISCDLSLHSLAIRCRQKVKTVLEHIDCERLAKTVTKRAVILTNFMLSNLIEALVQCLTDTTLLATLTLEGLPLKIPYFSPLCEAILSNNSLRHIHLPRCGVGDAGCQALCRAVRCLPGVLTLDLTGCEITPLGAAHIADLIKFQKIHRYSENWVHTLRYRLPELDAMAGLRRITLCCNPGLGDAGLALLFEVLADDLWIKALDVQDCGLTEASVSGALRTVRSNTTLTVLDLRHNGLAHSDELAQLRAALAANERAHREHSTPGNDYMWLDSVSGSSSEGRLIRQPANLRLTPRDRNRRTSTFKNINRGMSTKKEKSYVEALEERLQEEIAHRHQLEELNLRLVDQVRQLKRQQIQLWSKGTTSSDSERSLAASELSSAGGSASSGASAVPVDQGTLAYIQHAFRDIYAFIKENQCQGQCERQTSHEGAARNGGVPVEPMAIVPTELEADVDDGIRTSGEPLASMTPKKAHSTHKKLTNARVNKSTKSAHLLGERDGFRESVFTDTKLEMIEKQIGDTAEVHVKPLNLAEQTATSHPESQKPRSRDKQSPCRSIVSDSSDTLVCAPDPRRALFSTDDESDSSDAP